MSSMDVRSITPSEGISEMTGWIGQLFLMDYFFNEKHGKPYAFSVIGSDGSNVYHIERGGYSFSEKPLRHFGAPVVQITMGVHIKSGVLEERSNVLIPATGSEVRNDNLAWIRILCAERDYSENDRTIRFGVEAWNCDYHLDEERSYYTGWMFASEQRESFVWMTFDKRTHKITVSKGTPSPS